ncbi:uncharacterized protein Z520_00721 [Fonsecaea multimorphosa CBS 102226]|uniref:Increased recombination centers protein 6 n=1 Tax=Fonsecaea multimorphosa CBS 102226 TaxID=1442371 RepID=A0A0D2L4Q0_9EURO|nr:uncharacterized protein Z520_00721 [Fonsecaea multimorphosa CBS 102226]KIY04029.1 hypothetical protein Z520_00721 [Fonsecaea multimorphosa CBS 102226]OAL31865.1 hypothetical protein AYO22_00735 [Fonsecaea multimorphosa]
MTSNPPPTTKPSSFRLLILSPSPPDRTTTPPFRAFLEAVTGSKPSDEVTSFAGYTSHPPLRLRTKYYSADVSIWCDELPFGDAAVETTKKKSAAGKDPSHGPDSEGGKQAPLAESASVTLEEWKEQMLSSEAAEVRAVIGGVILILPLASSTNASLLESYVSLVETVHALREAIEDESYGRDVASLVVVQSTATASTVSHARLNETMEGLEEICLSERGILGWDFVAWNDQLEEAAREEGKDGKAVEEGSHDISRHGEDERNEFGEKTGIKRVIEALEAVDWSASPHSDGEEDGLGDFNFADVDDDQVDDTGDLFSSTTSKNILGDSTGLLGIDYELQREMMELKMSMLEDIDDSADDNNKEGSEREQEDEDTQVEQLQVLMERVVAIREAGSEMPMPEREKFARREIGRIMREMG